MPKKHHTKRDEDDTRNHKQSVTAETAPLDHNIKRKRFLPQEDQERQIEMTPGRIKPCKRSKSKLKITDKKESKFTVLEYSDQKESDSQQ